MAEIEKQQEEIKVKKNGICEKHDGYYLYLGEDKGYKQLSNFLMEPLNSIDMPEGNKIEMRFSLRNGVVKEEILDGTSFANAQLFKKAIKRMGGIEMTWNGSESDLQGVQDYLTNKYRNFSHCVGLPYVGLYKQDDEWVYTGVDSTVNRKGEKINTVISVVENNDYVKSEILDIKPIRKEGLTMLAKDLFRFNTLERTVNIIGWVSACFFKERLWQRKIKTSHLVIAGGAGSGKSETVEKIVQPIFSMIVGGVACKGLTNFSILKSLHSSNLIPFILEEYKPHKLNQAELGLISGTMRSTYDYQTTQRGRQDQSVVNYTRRAPLILVGESSFDETAIKERIIDVQFAKKDRTKEHEKVFKSLTKNDRLLRSFGRALLQNAMNLSEDRLDELFKASRVFENMDFENRLINGISNVYLGILILADLYSQFGLNFWKLAGVTDQEVRKAIIDNTYNALDGNSKVNSAVDIIIKHFDDMAVKNKIRKGYEYEIDKDSKELWLRVNGIYSDFMKYIKDYNLTNEVEALTSKQFTTQLKKEMYFKKYTERKFKHFEDGQEVIQRAKCFVLDLKILQRTCELDAFALEEEELLRDKDGFVQVPEEIQEQLPFV